MSKGAIRKRATGSRTNSHNSMCRISMVVTVAATGKAIATAQIGVSVRTAL